jgi:hypothetical protein
LQMLQMKLASWEWLVGIRFALHWKSWWMLRFLAGLLASGWALMIGWCFD